MADEPAWAEVRDGVLADLDGADYDEVLGTFLASAYAIQQTMDRHGRYGSHFIEQSAEQVERKVEEVRNASFEPVDETFDARFHVDGGKRGVRRVRVLRASPYVDPNGRVKVAGRIEKGPSEGRWFTGKVYLDTDFQGTGMVHVQANLIRSGGAVRLGGETVPKEVRPDV